MQTSNSWEIPVAANYPNERLGLVAEVADSFLPLERPQIVGEGGEAKVYRVDSYNSRTGNSAPQAVKVYHNIEGGSDFEEQLFALSAPIMSVATTARWADSVYNPSGMLGFVNECQAGIERLGLQDPRVYSLANLRETYPDFRQLDLHGYTACIIGMFHQKGIPVPQELQGMFVHGGVLRLPADYKGGLGTYINTLVSYTSKKYPQLELPNRIFPKMGTFGYIDPLDSRVDPTGIARGHLALTMEWVPTNLEQLAIEGYNKVKNNGGSMHRDRPELAVIAALGDYIRQHAPLEQIKQVRTMLTLLGSMGLVFGDLKHENIGITQNRQVVLLDPGTVVKKGSIQDFATEDYLPDGSLLVDGVMRNPRDEFDRSELRAHPWFDQVALNKMLNELLAGGVTSAVESLKEEYRQAERQQHVRQVTARALKRTV